MPDKPELKIKEFEIFRSFYCGVCKSIGKRFGQLPRAVLNYDSAFLALLISSIIENIESLEVRKERCIAHPLKKSYVIKNNTIIDYASDMNIILAYHNFKDNWKDERSVLSAAGMTALGLAYRNLSRKYYEKCAIIEKRLQELSELESSKCDSMDRAAEPFARLMEEVMATSGLFHDEKADSILRWIGYNIGKWIYILDAYDDIEKDIRGKSYNPLIFQFKYDNGDIDAFKDRIRERVEFNLTHSLSQIAKAYELLEVKDNSGIIENIVYMGMLKKTEQILKTGSCKKIEKSI